MTSARALRVGLLNVDWNGWSDRRSVQARTLAALELDVLCLLEVAAPDIAGFTAECGFAWSRCSVAADSGPRRPGVAILGAEHVLPQSVHQLTGADFLAEDSPIDEGLAQRFHDKHLAVDVDVGTECTLRVGAFHAPAARTRFNGEEIGERKPWYHARIARWVAAWPSPYLFAIDANTPRVDLLAWSQTRVHWPSTADRPGEELLVGSPDQALHRAQDLWRTWLAGPAGAADRALVPEGGPLAHSWGTRNRYRFDQIWATEEARPREMRYEYDAALSDHALVTATVEVGEATS